MLINLHWNPIWSAHASKIPILQIPNFPLSSLNSSSLFNGWTQRQQREHPPFSSPSQLTINGRASNGECGWWRESLFKTSPISFPLNFLVPSSFFCLKSTWFVLKTEEHLLIVLLLRVIECLFERNFDDWFLVFMPFYVAGMMRLKDTCKKARIFGINESMLVRVEARAWGRRDRQSRIRRSR